MSTQQGILGTLLGWVPAWVGFGLIILVGIVAIIYGAFITPSAGLVAFGVAAIIGAILAWIVGGKGAPSVGQGGKSLGATLDHLDGWAWLVIFALFLVALLIAVLA